MGIDIVGVADRPDLVPVAARWIWEEWGRRKGRPLDGVIARFRLRTAVAGPERTVMLLDDGVIAGTASLVHEDLDERPELTPWLASVFVDPAYRGRGHAARLVRNIEATCRAGGIPTLWLHTEHASGLYAKLGWQAVGPADDGGYAVTVMRRDFGKQP